MTEQEVIDYFKTHGLEIQEYNIDENGNITLRANENWERNGPQELKDYFTDNDLFGITAIGYNGLPNSNGNKTAAYSFPWPGCHRHKGEDIFLGTLPCHYYCDNEGKAYTTGIGGMPNPSQSSTGRRTPSTFGITAVLSGINVNASVDSYHFHAYDGYNTLTYNFTQGRDLRYQRFMNGTVDDGTTNATNYRFCMNLIITLSKQVWTAEGYCDQPILNFILSPFAGEYDTNTSTGKYVKNAIKIVY